MKNKLGIYIISTLFFTSIFGQNKIDPKLKTAFSGRLTIGTQMAHLENYGATNWSTAPGLHLGIEPYIKLRWKNSFDLSVGTGAYLNSYNFVNANFAYNIAYYNYKFESRFSKYLEMRKGPFDFISFGLGVGITPHSHEYTSKSTSDFTAITETTNRDPFYFSPHIGTYRREDRFGYSLSLQCTFYRGDEPYIYFDLKSNNSYAQGYQIGNYIGLNLIVDYDLHSKKKSIDIKFPYSEPEDLESRENIVKNELHVKKRTIRIYVWDHGIIDHDTVSILVNDHPVISNELLTFKKKKAKVKLTDVESRITLYAHNEGSVKPNTAAMLIKVGLRKYHYVLNSTLSESEELKIIYE